MPVLYRIHARAAWSRTVAIVFIQKRHFTRTPQFDTIEAYNNGDARCPPPSNCRCVQAICGQWPPFLENSAKAFAPIRTPPCARTLPHILFHLGFGRQDGYQPLNPVYSRSWCRTVATTDHYRRMRTRPPSVLALITLPWAWSFQDNSLGASRTVTVYIDEAPVAFSSQTLGAALDLERVEVLKGPQGTHFGGERSPAS